MTFEDWIKTFPEELDAPSIGFARQVWQAAQKAERDRTTEILLRHLTGTPFDWDTAVQVAMEEINEP